MTDSSFFLSFVQSSMIAALKISLPVLITAVIVGFGIGIFQSVTHIQDASVSFIPKMIALILVLFIFGQWLLHSTTKLFVETFSLIPNICIMK